MNKIEYIDLLKVDVEGHELDVLIGAGDFIQKIKLIQFEFGGTNIDTRNYFRDYFYFFKNNGFNLFRLTPSGKLIGIFKYNENEERFTCMNYIAINNLFTIDLASITLDVL